MSDFLCEAWNESSSKKSIISYCIWDYNIDFVKNSVLRPSLLGGFGQGAYVPYSLQLLTQKVAELPDEFGVFCTDPHSGSEQNVSFGVKRTEPCNGSKRFLDSFHRIDSVDSEKNTLIILKNQKKYHN